MAWTTPAHNIQEVNAAGKVIAHAFRDFEVFAREHGEGAWPLYTSNIAIIQNWRSSHNFPLNTFQMNLRNATRKYDKRAIVSQRTKRLVSIGNKLAEKTSMKLSQMQDIGGCRAVVESIQQVEALARYYTSESRIKHCMSTQRPMTTLNNQDLLVIAVSISSIDITRTSVPYTTASR